MEKNYQNRLNDCFNKLNEFEVSSYLHEI
ncbi:TPA: hypothetical protein R4Y11_003763 [Citrobacter freundii]|uniref:Uncharacterized protein n=1 Tax=Citrobacter freundii TaxID=546 RepID=A0AAD2PP18_CITFR|nr:hypothetical protein [Citrobacter freundii 47N]EKT9387684.1 hypothetical protein [Citrobacter freundii]EKU0865925.1 hypothetical protein [Citrobacter freundii]EKU1806689.1 hypothetical protein [Citrobacter freundii]EKU8445657.1 hypothetical protein [Citrobacter freundii]